MARSAIGSRAHHSVKDNSRAAQRSRRISFGPILPPIAPPEVFRAMQVPQADNRATTAARPSRTDGGRSPSPHVPASRQSQASGNSGELLARRYAEVAQHRATTRRRAAGHVGPRLRGASGAPSLKRACQTLTAWAETPSWRATPGWRTPAANNSAARSRRPGASHVLVLPQGGEGQLASLDLTR
jgi:hypothetical protein